MTLVGRVHTIPILDVKTLNPREAARLILGHRHDERQNQNVIWTFFIWKWIYVFLNTFLEGRNSHRDYILCLFKSHLPVNVSALAEMIVTELTE
jgi:hypothetical protein